jgi:hypothetical protein
MADHNESIERPEEETVRALFTSALHEQPEAPDLLPGALTRYQRKRSRLRVTYAVGGVLAIAAAAAVTTTAIGGPGTKSGKVSPGVTGPAPNPNPQPASSSPKAAQPPSVPGCNETWLVQDTPRPGEISDPKMEIGPRTQEQASWICNRIVPALSANLGGPDAVTIDVFKSSFTFNVQPGTAKKPMPADGYPPAKLGTFQIKTKDGRTAVFTSYAYAALYQQTFTHVTTATRCSMPGTTCVKDGDYTVLTDGSWPEGTGFWVYAPNGDALTMAINGGSMSSTSGDGTPSGPSGFQQIPLTAAQLKIFDGNVALVKIAEDELKYLTGH